MSIPNFLLQSATADAPIDVSRYNTLTTETGDQLLPLMHELSGLTDQFRELVDSRLTESETDFLLAFQTHMTTVNGDLEALRKRADSREAEERREERIKVLKREVEWFKNECVRLNDVVKVKTKDNRRLNEKLSGLNEELNLSVPKFIIPVGNNRNLALLVEQIVKIFIDQKNGVDKNKDFLIRYNKFFKEQP